MKKTDEKSQFDDYSCSYDEELGKGLSLTGESRAYYAGGRIGWVAGKLKTHGISVTHALDFGCGVGDSCPLLQEKLNAAKVVGLDVSTRSLEEARKGHESETIRFHRIDEFSPRGDFDLVYCNGVFHHIAPGERAETVDYIYRLLRPGGIFALWENNPWNPGTRLIMKRVPFDRDAVMLWPAETRRLLKQINFSIIDTSYLFVFPRVLRMFRFIEPYISMFPFGGQYLVLGKKNA